MESSPYEHEDDIPHICPDCGETGDIAMFMDDGEWHYFEDDSVDCDSCGGIMEECSDD